MIKKHFGKHTFSNSHNQDLRSGRRDWDRGVRYNYIGSPLYYTSGYVPVLQSTKLLCNYSTLFYTVKYT